MSFDSNCGAQSFGIGTDVAKLVVCFGNAWSWGFPIRAALFFDPDGQEQRTGSAESGTARDDFDKRRLSPFGDQISWTKRACA